MKKYIFISFGYFLVIIISCTHRHSPKTITWNFNNPRQIGGHTTTILGNPVVVKNENATSVYFNGKDDGIIVPHIPIQGWQNFTIEALFSPSSSGPIDPRFLHFEDSLQNRCTMEVRITPGKEWYLDAFLKNGSTGKGFALIDSTKLHVTDRWYWVALTYDGKVMKSFVNGQQELERKFIFPVISGGQLSLGVRLNKVNWFRGKISELRFHPSPLPGNKLQRL